MARNTHQQTVDAGIREVYEEFTLSSSHVAMISDPENEYAWIQSNYTMPIEA